MTIIDVDNISIECDGTAKELWEKCLILHLVHSPRAADLDPACALVMLTGCTHDEADAAHDEMDRHLSNNTPRGLVQ